jgi:glycosyltransferase involved in cell wall biosynthesis
MYGVEYNVIRNIALLNEHELPPKSETPFFIYQGAINEGRSFETLIPAMKKVNTPLYVYGEGNYFKQTQKLIQEYHLSEKVQLMGKLKPEALRQVTLQAYAGITLFENNGKSNYLSLANRFFDYIQAGIPQLCVNYPAYKEINDKYDVALLIDDLSSETISKALNLLVTDHVLYNELKQNCALARKKLNWQAEEKKLISIYRSIEK